MPGGCQGGPVPSQIRAAGVQEDDVILGINGQRMEMTLAEFHAPDGTERVAICEPVRDNVCDDPVGPSPLTDGGESSRDQGPRWSDSPP